MDGTYQDVSRETQIALATYQSLLEKWNPRINLVAKATLPNAVDRHFKDSLQLLEHIKDETGSWYDLGSGGGFPGLVCAIAAVEIAPQLKFHLVESDARKCAFLNAVLRETSANAQVHSSRIEALSPTQARYISARALAPVSKLLDWSEHLIGETTTCLFLKGEKAMEELEAAKRKWSFSEKIVKSQTNESGAILVLKDVTRV